MVIAEFLDVWTNYQCKSQGAKIKKTFTCSFCQAREIIKIRHKEIVNLPYSLVEYMPGNLSQGFSANTKELTHLFYQIDDLR